VGCGMGLSGGGDDFGDADAEAIIDDDDFAAGEAFAVNEEINRGIGRLIELDDGAGGELEDVAHGHLAGAEFDGELDAEIQEELEVGGGMGFHRNGSGLGRENAGQFESPVAGAGAEAGFELGKIGESHGDLFGAMRGELEDVVGFKLGKLLEGEFEPGPFGGDGEAEIIELTVPGRGNALGEGSGSGVIFEGLAELADERFEGFVGKSDLDLFHAIADACLHGEGEHDDIGCGGAEEAAVGFVAEEDGLEILDIGPVTTPFGEEELDGLVKEGELDFAEVVIGGDGVSGATEEAVDDGEAEARMEFEDGDAAEWFDFEKGDVSGVGEAFDELLKGDGLELGHLEREVEAQEDRQSCGEAAEVFFMTQAQFAEFERGEKRGVPEVIGLDGVAGDAVEAAVRVMDLDAVFLFGDLGEETFDLGLGEDLLGKVGISDSIHG
jgi:hypothetical protein